jgi:divinyl chlorophyllide a 8-vinyl-reductase
MTDSGSDRGERTEPSKRRRVFVAGATGYIGRQVVRELVARGHEVVAFARVRSGALGKTTEDETRARLEGAEVRFGDVTSKESLARDGLRAERFDAVVSCIASRTGGVKESWRIEHEANLNLMALAAAAGLGRFVLLSAICVQRPLLAFQHAKLAFEQALIASGTPYSIVRPTAFFKSLSGQLARVQQGKPFAVFGDGERTACKPISERDLARLLADCADCIDDPALQNRILPVGGPGEAISPKQQAALLAELLGRPVKLRHVPVGLLDAIIAVLSLLGRVFPRLADKAEFARIGRYYATESMLVFDAAQGRYDAAATPSHGTETLRDFYARALREGLAGQELGDQAVFGKK